MEKFSVSLGENLKVAAKSKSNGDLHKVLALLENVVDFRDKVAESAEAQENPKNVKVMQDFIPVIEEFYDRLIDIAQDGLETIRHPVSKNDESQESEEEGKIKKVKRDGDKSTTPKRNFLPFNVMNGMV